MYFKKYQIHICFLLIISLLLCGMCFETVQTDSSFVCSTFDKCLSDTSTASALRSSSKTFPSEQVYTPEALGQREIAAGIRQSARRSILKLGRGSYCALWTAVITPQPFSAALRSRALTVMHAVRSNAIILVYIHHQDGKKSDYLI